MGITAAIVPHAPLLVGEVSPAHASTTEDLRDAVKSLDVGGGDELVIVSPHGRASGVYAFGGGSLEGFGIPSLSVRAAAAGADLVNELAWWGGLLEGGVDHGILVPQLLGLGAGIPVVGVALKEITGQRPLQPDGAFFASWDFDGVIGKARALGNLLRDMSRDRDLVLVASVNTSAALTERAPLTEQPRAKQVERETLDVLSRRVGTFSDDTDLQRRLWQEGGSCAVGPLVALGCAFPEGRAVPLSYDAPFGVGYLVGQVIP